MAQRPEHTMPKTQLALHFRLDKAATFDNFLVAANATAIAALRDAREPFVHIWGESATGKSHLLQAVCHAAGHDGHNAVYLPLAEPELSPAMLVDLEQAAQVICIDDVHCIAGRRDWEHGLFHLFNRARESHTRLLTAAQMAPPAMPLELADLKSRLGWGPTFRLKSLSDEDKFAALRMRAEARGMHLSEEVGRFLLNHASRDLHNLFTLLERLDEASLREQRRLTIPFVRQFI